MIKMQTFTILSLSFMLQIYAKIEMRLPPTITKDIEPLEYGRKQATIAFSCKATGVDKPEYSWYKDDELISSPGVNGNLVFPETNILHIKTASKADEGRYFCEAKNSYGLARTNTTNLKIADLEGFHTSKPKEMEVKAYESIKLDCDKIKSTPKASYRWAVKSENPNEPKSEIKTDSRVAIDDDGTLHFNYVMKSDERDGMIYSCEVKNHVNDHTQGTGYVKLRVMAGELKEKKPVLLFATGDKTNNVVKAVVGENVNLRCFYSSYPYCKQDWRIKTIGKDGKEIEKIEKNRNHVWMQGVVESNSGDYTCVCEGDKYKESHRIKLVVESKPSMLRPEDMLTNLNITEGETGVFNCSPYSNPPSSISWSKDGVPMEEKDLQLRWSMNEDKTQLRIRDVCKECYSASDAVVKSDLSVIQCDVKNVHAHYTYSAYLNVIRRTTIITSPESKSVKFDEGALEASFYCTATTDDLTPLSLRWRFLPKGKTFEENVHSDDGKISLEKDNTTLVINVQNSTEWPQHEGKYTCIADNGYSHMTSSADLSVVMPSTVAPKVAPTIMSAGLPWWVFLVVVLLVLLLLLLVCCCCLWREKGGVYKVDLKERKNGNDPVKELKDDQFKDYQRPSTDFLKGSRASLGSSIPMNSDDEGSLNEYGDIDAGKFGEDGSFIGDYNTDNRNKQRYNNNNSYSNGNGVAKGNVFNPNTFGPNGYQRV